MSGKFVTATVAGALTILAVTAIAGEPLERIVQSDAESATAVLSEQLQLLGLQVLGASQPDSGKAEDVVLVVRPDPTVMRAFGKEGPDQPRPQ